MVDNICHIKWNKLTFGMVCEEIDSMVYGANSLIGRTPYSKYGDVVRVYYAPQKYKHIGTQTTNESAITREALFFTVCCTDGVYCPMCFNWMYISW